MKRQKPGSQRTERQAPARRKTRLVVILAAPGTQILDVAGPFQVFVRASEIAERTAPNLPPAYRVELIGTARGPISTNCGLRLESTTDYGHARRDIDTFLVAGGNDIEEGLIGAPVLRWARAVAKSSRRVGSICTGAFLLGQIGLLNNRRVATHWKYCDLLQTKFPKTQVDPEPIFIRDGNVYTSAGVTAGMDLSLELIEEDLGSIVALQVARELVLYMRRPGGQSQFSAALSLQEREGDCFRGLGAWVLENLRGELSVRALSRHAAMSPRNFARRFTDQFHTTPAKYVESLRVEAARRSLEQGEEGLEQIAATCGWHSADAMRSTFRRVLRVSPRAYRERFKGSEQPEE